MVQNLPACKIRRKVVLWKCGEDDVKNKERLETEIANLWENIDREFINLDMKLQRIGTGQHIHAVANMRSCLQSMQYEIDDMAKLSNRFVDLIAVVGKFLEEIAKSMADGVIEAREIEAIEATWRLLCMAVEGLLMVIREIMKR